MNRLFTLKTTFIVFFITVCQLSLRAQSNTTPSQKDTSKIILVVLPGQNSNKPAPQKTTSSTPANVATNSAGVKGTSTVKTTPVNTAASTAERSGANANKTPANTAPIRTSTTGYAAPSTAERSGAPTYMAPSSMQKPVLKQAGTPAAAGTPSKSNTAVITPVNPAANGSASGTIKPVNPVNSTAKTDTGFIKDISSVRSTKIAFLEFGGPGLAFTLNYDARLSGERNGLGYRVGAGYYNTGANSVLSVPVQVNYLIGRTDNFIELGGGTTFLNSNGSNKGKTFIFDKVTGFIGTATIGYRYQSEDRALNFRIGFVPIFYDEGIIYAGGVSIGYTLK